MIQIYRFQFSDGSVLYPRRIWGNDFVDAMGKATKSAASHGMTVYGYEYEGILRIEDIEETNV